MSAFLLDTEVNAIRTEIKTIAKRLLTLKCELDSYEAKESEDRVEVIANIMLAYRHLEDARMRLGKVLQAYDGGVSVYDKATTERTTKQWYE